MFQTGWNLSHSLHILSFLCMSRTLSAILLHYMPLILLRSIKIYRYIWVISMNGSVNAWYELVLDDFAISLPIFSILHCTSLEIPSAAMDQDSDEEHGVEVWNRWRSPNTETPSKTLNPVGSVILYESEIIVDANQKTIRTGLRAYAHHPLVRRRLLQQFIR